MKNKTMVVIDKFESVTEVESAIKDIGDLQREKSELENSANSKIQALQEELAKEIEPLNGKINSIAYGVKAFSDKNRASLMKDKKSLEMPTGTIAYRSKPARVLTKFTQKYLAAILEKNGLTKYYEGVVKKFEKIFLNVKLELDKTSILNNQEKAGELIDVEIENDVERFYIKPNTVDTEIELSDVA